MIENNARYANIAFDDVVNGEGLGAVLFVQYCPHHCKQCHNPSTWNKDGGKEFTIDVADSLMQYYDTVPFANRLTISGGEPLTEINLGMTKYIVDRFKNEHPDKKIWIYTGYNLDHLFQLIGEKIIDSEINMLIDIVKQCDVIIDGKYVHGLRDVSLSWRGSSNQRVIDVQKSLKERQIILYDK